MDMKRVAWVLVLQVLATIALSPLTANADDLPSSQQFHESGRIAFVPTTATPADAPPVIFLWFDFGIGVSVDGRANHSAHGYTKVGLDTADLTDCARIRGTVRAGTALSASYFYLGTIVPNSQNSQDDDSLTATGCYNLAESHVYMTIGSVDLVRWSTIHDMRGQQIQWRDGAGTWHDYVASAQELQGTCSAESHWLQEPEGDCDLEPSPV